MDRPVNLLRATTTCNTFYVFLSAAKAALLPFLTLFFRLIGLSALETGIVMAAKTLTGFVWAPLWARCAVAYNKRRVVLVFSLLMMGVMYMSFTAVYYKVGNLQSCQVGELDGHHDGNVTGSNASLAADATSHSASGPVAALQDLITPVHTSGHSSEKSGGVDTSSTAQPDRGPETTRHPAIIAPPATKTPKPGTSKPVTPEPVTPNSHTSDSAEAHNTPAEPAALEKEEHHGIDLQPAPPPDKSHQTSGNPTTPDAAHKPHSLSPVEIDKLEKHMIESTGYTFKDIQNLGLSAHQIFEGMKKNAPSMNLSEADIQQILDARSTARPPTIDRSHRVRRNLNMTFFNNLKDKVGVLAATLEEKKLLLFLVVLLIIIFGEFFSSPVEKIADDAWFDFLERIDDMEKYGRQRYWGSLTFALVPIVVAAVVDYTPCKMLFNMHHFLMHFYVFGVFMIFTLFLAFYFPMPPPVKQKYSSKVGKGLRAICCDGRGFLFVITLLVAGMVYASFNNFLFWRLQDLGGSEVVMGLCVAIGAFAETPMLIFSNKLVMKLGNGGVVSLALFALAMRVLFYGFLWTPWAVLPAELTNAFTHTAMWYAVLSYDEFNVGSAIDRSIRSILSSIYFGLGFSLGSFLSGLVYHVYGASVLFWGASVVSGAWCLLYSLIQLCLPKKERVKYIKLLRNEEDESSDGEDDWLEMALKDQ
ncbi:hypothetical protein V1264_012865 [Littorina saxatilis]